MAKKRLTIGARVKHKKMGVLTASLNRKSSLGKGKWMIKWSDKEAEEEVHSRSLCFFEEIEEESSSSSSDEENSMHDDGSSSDSGDEHAKKSEKFDKFAATLVGKSVGVITNSFNSHN